MKYKIAEVNPVKLHGRFTVYYDENAKVNPYYLYHEWNDPRHHKKLVQRYADLFSCSCVIHQYIGEHNEESR